MNLKEERLYIMLLFTIPVIYIFAIDEREKSASIPWVFGRQEILEIRVESYACRENMAAFPPPHPQHSDSCQARARVSCRDHYSIRK